MKKKRVLRLLLSLIIIVAFCTSGQNTFVANAWSQPDHEASVTKANISAKGIDMTLVKLVARSTDDWYGTKKEKFQVNALHGLYNYVANLKFLYEVVYKYKNYTRNLNDPDTKWVTETYNESWAAATVAPLLVDAAKREVTEASTDKARASRVLGLAAHLAGDIFAHRLIVPKSTLSGERGIDNPKTGKGNLLGTSDFTTAEWSNVVDLINSGTLQCYEIKYHMKTSSSSKYEDNTSYYPSRYSIATNWALKNMFEELNDGIFDMRVTVLSPNVSGYTGKLDNFDYYCGTVGY